MNGLKTYFLSFFTHKHAKASAGLPGTGVLLGVIAAIVLIFGGAITGYIASFNSHYRAANEFRDFAYSAFSGEDRVEFTLKNGKLTSSALVDSFADGEYIKNGYYLIVDTREDLAELFDDCEVYYSDGKNEISYEEWGALKGGKNKYALKIRYSGVALDTSDRHTDYIAYLEMLSDKNSPEYDKSAAARFANIKADRQAEHITERQFEDRIYSLYFSVYYPSISKIEHYGSAPTLLQYYSDRIAQSKGKVLALTHRVGRAYFINSKGVAMRVEGGYGADSPLAITEQTSDSAAHAALDKLIDGIFKESRSQDVSVYVLNVVIAAPWLLLAFFVCVSIVAAAERLRKKPDPTRFGAIAKTVGSFFFISAAIAFAVAVPVAFGLSRTAAFNMTIVAFAVALNIRTVVFVVTDGLRGTTEEQKAPLPISINSGNDPIN